MTKMTQVAAGVLINPITQEFLLASRPEGKVYAGYWEFPGGKIEQGETAYQALVRELEEELGIQVQHATPWLTQTFVYPHATVRLAFFKVTQWQGVPQSREGQDFAWHPLGTQNIPMILQANLPLLRALALPAIYAISHASLIGIDPYLAKLETALAQGLRLIQVRDKTLPKPERAALAQAIQDRAAVYQAQVLVNDDLALAQNIGAAGVHYSAATLQQLSTRPSDIALVGASCHDLAELQHAAAFGCDYALLGSVLATPSHPDAQLLGWQGVQTLLQTGLSLPVYALGGLNYADLAIAEQSGCHGIAMLRGI